tara:strand:+ start:264 stop:668 length:405 start_codon:yes stop_codon:yes gene_type:complete
VAAQEAVAHLEHKVEMVEPAEALGIVHQQELVTLHLYHHHKELTAEALVDIPAVTEAVAADHLDQQVVQEQTIQELPEAAEPLLHFQGQVPHTVVADLVAVELTQEHTTQTHHKRQAAEVLDQIVHQAEAELMD